MIDYDELFQENLKLKDENMKLQKIIEELKQASRPDDKDNGRDENAEIPEKSDEVPNLPIQMQVKDQEIVENIPKQAQVEEIPKQARVEEIPKQVQVEEIAKQVQVEEIPKQPPIEEIAKQAPVEELKINNNKLQLKRIQTSAEPVQMEKATKHYTRARATERKVDDIEGIVDVDDLVLDDSKNVVDPTPLKNVRDSLHYNYLEKEEQTRLLKFFSLANTQTNAYEDDTCVVKGKTVEDLMFDNFTDAEVINFYSKWLKKNEDIKCIYVSAYAWTHLKAGQHRSKEGLLDKVLKNEFTNDVKFVFFPINSSKSAFPHEGHYWSLLVLNGKTKKFQHYNSMRGRKGVDKYFDDANIMVCKTEYIHTLETRGKRNADIF
ncbi:hypothetical protein AQUCO_08400031v1 [Aquilegia coerulea]|uniref:Ubiquitin-like protease family profile domain-containing protein n=1 Tax=Aquilegia coerulea TaxID=218851 RepID=A0A2G5C6W8_AQUCA|nr:hypothetical protein AQUCO_08400031v1 [Aquilegia coerulea]